METEMIVEQSRGIAVITGASSGIGEVYAERLADRGYDLVLVARSRDKLAALAARLAARTGRRIETLTVDLASPEGRLAIEQRLHTDENITLLVNNAGISAGGPLATSNLDAADAMIAINISALTRLAAAAAAAFMARNRGAIVNIASAMAFIPAPTSAVYAASKAYVLHFSRALHDDLAPHGVHVQAVLPGYTSTPMLSEALLSTIPPERIMQVGELVDAALAGLDAGESVTIPSLPDAADWDALEKARLKIAAAASRNHPAERYLKQPAKVA
jgi:short-subunit dehydrogenase